jgi:gliding motility-associated-like protein
MAGISHFNIYNRTGQLVYSSADAGQGWDGTLNGQPQPEGTYIWTVKGQDYLGKIHEQKGVVVLIR